MKNLGILMLLFLATSFTFKSQDKPKSKLETVVFVTSAVCGECKERIEKELNYTKGIVFAELDMESKELTVKYKTKLIDEAQVIKVVTDLGYDAGESKRDEAAFAKLPKCCQSPGHCSRD